MMCFLLWNSLTLSYFSLGHIHCAFSESAQIYIRVAKCQKIHRSNLLVYRIIGNWKRGTSCLFDSHFLFHVKNAAIKIWVICWFMESLACYIVLDWVKLTLTILQSQLNIEHTSWVVSLASVQLWAILKQSAKNLNKTF